MSFNTADLDDTGTQFLKTAVCNYLALLTEQRNKAPMASVMYDDTNKKLEAGKNILSFLEEKEE